jgi:hypothetical protein
MYNATKGTFMPEDNAEAFERVLPEITAFEEYINSVIEARKLDLRLASMMIVSLIVRLRTIHTVDDLHAILHRALHYAEDMIRAESGWVNATTGEPMKIVPIEEFEGGAEGYQQMVAAMNEGLSDEDVKQLLGEEE